MTEPILFGAAYSVYVRAVRLALEEKQVPHRLVEIDIFAPGGPQRGRSEDRGRLAACRELPARNRGAR